VSEALPSGLDADRFRAEYLSRLRRHTPTLVARLQALLARTDVGPDVSDVEVQVFPDEYGDGFVSAWMYFNGRNRAVRKSDPSLYCGASIALTDDIRDMPLYDPDQYSFDTSDVTVRCVIDWFVECWEAAGGRSFRLPAAITGHDGFGTPDLLPLTTATRRAG